MVDSGGLVVGSDAVEKLDIDPISGLLRTIQGVINDADHIGQRGYFTDTSHSKMRHLYLESHLKLASFSTLDPERRGGMDERRCDRDFCGYRSILVSGGFIIAKGDLTPKIHIGYGRRSAKFYQKR